MKTPTVRALVWAALLLIFATPAAADSTGDAADAKLTELIEILRQRGMLSEQEYETLNGRAAEREILVPSGSAETNGNTGDSHHADPAPRQESPEKPAEVANVDAAPPTPGSGPLREDEGWLPTWKLTDALTFTPAMRLQFRYSYLEPADPQNNFQIRRFRLKGKGDILNLARYYAEMKIDGTGFVDSPSAAIENAYLEFNTLPHTNLRLGLYDIPFSRNALTSDSKLLFMNRTLIKGALTAVGFADNTIGALFHEILFDGRFGYGVGVFRNDKFDKVPTVAGRLSLHLLDPGKRQGRRGSYANYRGSYIGEGQRFDMGFNSAYTPSITVTSTTAPDAKGDVYAVGGDIFFNMGRFTLQGEYDWYKMNMVGVSDVPQRGGYVQAAYLLTRGESSWIPPTEFAVRYQDLDGGALAIPDLDITLPDAGRRQAYEVGMNYYIRGHNLKVQTNYTYLDSEATGTSNIYELQMQLDF
jgi:hypothetical protein